MTLCKTFFFSLSETISGMRAEIYSFTEGRVTRYLTGT